MVALLKHKHLQKLIPDLLDDPNAPSAGEARLRSASTTNGRRDNVGSRILPGVELFVGRVETRCKPNVGEMSGRARDSLLTTESGSSGL